MEKVVESGAQAQEYNEVIKLLTSCIKSSMQMLLVMQLVLLEEKKQEPNNEDYINGNK